jgi:hypothetical protein
MRRNLTDIQRKSRNFRVSERRRKLKILAINYKGGKCIRCGYDKCPRSLDFHHLDPGEKDFSISQNGDTISFDRIKAEIDKCILVCKNCHGEIHHEQDVINIEQKRKIFGAKKKERLSDGWPNDNDFLNMSKEFTISEISEKINKSKSVIYNRLAKLKNKNGNQQVVYRNKINWPTDDELLSLVWQKSRTQLAKEFGVSDNAIIKRCKLRDIKMPGRGYWQKLKSAKHSEAHSSIGRTV